MGNSSTKALLEVQDLEVSFRTRQGELRALDRISFDLMPGDTLGVVGESGCGKSLTSLAIMGLLPPTADVKATRLYFEGRDLLRMTETQRRMMRGGDISMIFQDPMTSLNPSFNVGFQIKEMLMTHEPKKYAGKSNQEQLQSRCVELLKQVGIPDPADRLHAYPHHLSGGMSQRVMIAMAIACCRKLLIADEPTTALDVTIQAQILGLIRKLQKELGLSLILITHDIGVVAENTRKLLVMYAGQIVERGMTSDIIRHPRHPYTERLLQCLPEMHMNQPFRTRLPSIKGIVPNLIHRPKGCQLHPRCPYVADRCKSEEPQDVNVKCHFPLSGRERSGVQHDSP